MSSEVTALLASISFALFAVYGWLGLRHSTPLTATIVSLAARTITLGVAVILFGGVPGFAMAALVVFVILGVMQNFVGVFISPQAMSVTPFVVIMLILVLRPQGLFGELALKKV